MGIMGTRNTNRNPGSSLQFSEPVRFLLPSSFASLCTPVALLHCKELPLNPCTLITSRYRAPELLSQSLPYAFFQLKHPTLTETSLRALHSTYQVRGSDGPVGARSCNHHSLPLNHHQHLKVRTRLEGEGECAERQLELSMGTLP